MKQHYLLTSNLELTLVNRYELASLYYGVGDSPFGPWCIEWNNLGLVYSNMIAGDQESNIM